jgi:hypothetical protein
MDSEIKQIVFLPATKEDTGMRRKKVATESEDWARISQKYSTKDAQLELLRLLSFKTLGLRATDCASSMRNGVKDELSGETTPDKQWLLSHLRTKQSGYRSQDVAKGWYDESRFVRIEDIVAILSSSGLTCFYCGCWTLLFYEYARDPKQWSLERISNSEGHNRENIVLACLECNMRRRTMYYERYVATKQLKVVKMD